MKNFKIVFYKSELGELVKVKEFFKEADAVQDLVSDPPDEFFEMLGSFLPIHGWAEMESPDSTIYVIFAPKNNFLESVDEVEFHDWVESTSPADVTLDDND